MTSILRIRNIHLAAAVPLALLVGCSTPGFVLKPHEGDEGFAVPRMVFYGTQLAVRSAPGVDDFEVPLPEGKALQVRREMSAGRFTAAADLNFDGDFGDEEALSFPAEGATQHVVRPEGTTAVRLKLNAGGKAEYRLEPVYTTTVTSGEESLDVVAALHPPDGVIMFGDPQRDGSFPMFISPETVIGLGGRGFTASVAYDPLRVMLTESDQPTSQPGDPLPTLEGTALAGVIDEAGEDSEVVLIFAHPECRGCMSWSELADLARAASEHEQRWVWVVQDEAHVELIRGSMGEGQSVVTDAGAWGTLGASATPTVLRLSPADQSGMRTVVGRISAAKTDRLLLALGWE